MFWILMEFRPKIMVHSNSLFYYRGQSKLNKYLLKKVNTPKVASNSKTHLIVNMTLYFQMTLCGSNQSS